MQNAHDILTAEMKRINSFQSHSTFTRVKSFLKNKSFGRAPNLIFLTIMLGICFQHATAQSPGTVSVDLVSSNGARIIWSVDDGCDDYRIRWGIVGTHTPGISEAGTVDRNDDLGCESGATTKMIGPLTPSTTYWVQVSRDADDCSLICQGGSYSNGGPFEPAGESLQFTTPSSCDISGIAVLNTIDTECSSEYSGEFDGRVTFNDEPNKIELSFTNSPPWSNFNNPPDPFNFTGTGLEVGYHTVYVRKGNNTCLHFTDLEIFSLDTIAPDLFCPNDTIVINDPNSCDYTINTFQHDFIGFDNCPEDVRVFYQIDTFPAVESFSLQGAILPVGMHTIKWIAFDVAENLTDCTFNIEVVDDEDPVPACQDTLTFSIESDETITLQANQLDNGSIDNCTSFEALQFYWDSTLTQQSRDFTIADAGAPFEVTMWVKDEAGNASSCTTVMHFMNGTPPVAVCNDITVDLGQDGNYSFTALDISDITVGTTDDEGSVSVALSRTSFDCADIQASPIDVTITYTDLSGNMSECISQVTVRDQIAPVLECVSILDITLNVECGIIIPDLTSDVTISNDNCDDVTITQMPIAGMAISGLTDDITLSVTLIATDESGNSSECLVILLTNDVSPPTFDCPEDLTMALDSQCCILVGDYTLVSNLMDNCANDVTVNQIPAPGSEICAMIVDVTLSASDGNGNATSCVVSVSGIDVFPPDVTCTITDLTVSLESECILTIPDLAGYLDIYDNCSDTFLVSQDPPVDATFEIANGLTHDVTIYVVDTSGNSAQCVIQVTGVADSLPPYECPADLTVMIDNDCQVTVPDFSSSLSSCQENFVSLSQNPVAGTKICADPGEVFQILLSYTEGNMQPVDCTIELTAIDDAPPVFNCPADRTVSLDDNCNLIIPDLTADHLPIMAVVDSGFQFVGSYNGHGYYLSQVDRNWSSAHIEASAAGGYLAAINSALEESWVDSVLSDHLIDMIWLGLTDNESYCGTESEGGGTTGGSGVPGTPFWVWTSGEEFIYSNWSADEPDNGNGGEDFVLLDRTLSDSTWTDVAGSTLHPFLIEIPLALDNCDPAVMISQLPLPGTEVSNPNMDALDNWSQDVTIFAEDENGNLASCVTTLTAIDDTAPIANCVDVTITIDTSGQAMLPVSMVDSSSFDNCGLEQITLSQSVFTGADVAVSPVLVTMTVTDVNGNIAVCTSLITIRSNDNLTLNCVDDITINLEPACTTTLDDYTIQAGIENGFSADVTVTQTPEAGTELSGVQVSDVTLFAVDEFLNEAQCTFSVTTRDTIPPVANCSDITLHLDSMGMVALLSDTIDNGSTDNCEIVNLMVSPNTFTCMHIGLNDVTLTVTDASGNTSNCIALVHVKDTLAPEIIYCPTGETIYLDEGCSRLLPDYRDSILFLDNCMTDVTIFQSPDAGTQYMLEETIFVTLSAVDASGNEDNCMFNVEVTDTLAPSVSCQDITINLSNDGTISIVPEDILVDSSDNCGIEMLTLSDVTFNCDDLGHNDVTLTVTDVNGNVTTCIASIYVQDIDVPAIISCAPNTTIYLDQNCEVVLPDFIPALSVTDNCIGDVTITQSPDSGLQYFAEQDVSVSFTASDAAGNINSCAINVVVLDTIKPMAVCQDITVSLDSMTMDVTIAVNEINAGSSDNCGIDNITLSRNSFDVSDIGDVLVELIVTDIHGNQSTCLATVTVIGEEVPGLTCRDVTVYLDSDGEGILLPEDVCVGTSQLCNDADLELSQDEFSCQDIGLNDVTLTATDDEDLVYTCTSIVTVKDTLAPVISDCPVDVTLTALSGECSGDHLWLKPAIYSDNCTDYLSLAFTLSVEAFDQHGQEIPISSQLFTAFGSFPVGVNTVYYSVTDENGNVGVCSFVVKILDNTDPQLQDCPESNSVSLTYQPGECGAIASWTPPTCVDACGCANVTSNFEPGSFFPVGTTTVMYQAVDSSGNQSQVCSFDVVVVDTSSHSIECEITEIEADQITSCRYVVPDLSDQITINSLCADVTITQDPAPGTEILDSTIVTVTVLDEVNGESECEILVVVPEAFSANFETENVSCYGDSNGTATVLPVNGTAPYVYQWGANANNQTGATAIGLAAGIYDVTVTDANNCVVVADTVIIQPTDITINISTTDVACSGQSNGSATVSVTGGVGPYSYLWDSNAGSQTDSTANNLMAGTYDVTITDANGCVRTASAEVIELIQLEVSITTNDVTCNGDATGSATAIVTGGSEPYDFNWSSGNDVQSTEMGLSAGAYDVTITDANGCEVTAAFSIFEPSEILADVTVTPTQCFGSNDGTITLSISGGSGGYSIDAGSGIVLNDSTITALTAGIYDVTISDANSCEKVITAEVTQPDQLEANVLVLNNVSCKGGEDASVAAIPGGGTKGYSFNWSNGSTDSIATDFGAGIHSLLVTDAHGCIDDITFEIVEPDDITLTAYVSQDVLCHGDSSGILTALASGGVGGFVFTWTDSLGSPVADTAMVPAGKYFLSAMDQNGCLAIDSTIVTQPQIIQITAATMDAGCDGGTDGVIDITVTGGQAEYSFLWSDDATVEDRSGLSAGTYDITVTDQNGCTSNGSWTIFESSAIVLNTSHTDASCNGASDGTITIHASGGTSPYTYDAGSGTVLENVISDLSAGVYDVTVTDSIGCTEIVSVEIGESSDLQISIIVDSMVSCFGGSDGSVSAEVSGGTMPYSYSWSNGSTDSTASAIAAGIHSLIVTDANGCVDDITFEMNEPTEIVLLTSTIRNTSCYAGSDGVIAVAVSGGTGTVDLNWEDQNGFEVVDTAMVSAGTFYVTATDDNGCSKSDSVLVSEPSQLAQSSIVGDVSCFSGSDGSIDVSISGGTPGYTYKWNDDVTLEDRTDLIAGNYDVTVTDSQGCVLTESWTISEPDLLIVTVAGDDPACQGESNGMVEAFVSGGSPSYSFLWSTGDTTSISENLAAGIYDVTVTDSKGCTATETIILEDPDDITITLVNAQNVDCNGNASGSIDIDVAGGSLIYSYNWSSGDTIQDPINLSAGIYDVTVTDSKGCEAFFSQEIIEPSALQVESVEATGVTCNGDSDGALNIEITGGTEPYSYLWQDGVTTEDRTLLVAGQYDVTVSDDNGCQISTSATIIEPTKLSATLTIQSASCNGQTDGSATANPTGGTSPYFYQWDMNAGSQTSQTAINLASGVYDVTITDSKGCTHVASAAVGGPAELVVTSSHTDVSCNGGADGTATASIQGGTGPYTFVWSNGVEVSDVTVSTIDSLEAGSYSVVITDVNGCDAVAFEMVEQPDLIILSAMITNEVCVNDGTGAIDLLVTGGSGIYIYEWSNDSTTEDLVNLVSGNYDVTVTDSRGCVATGTWEVNSFDDIKPSIICPPDLTLNCSADIPVVDLDDLTVSDNCAVQSFSLENESINSGLGCLSSPFVMTRTFIVTDASGNTETCQQLIWVQDTIPPSFSVPEDLTIAAGADCSYDASPEITGEVIGESDNCASTPTVSHTDSTISGGCTGELIIIRKWELLDDCGNRNVQIQTIVVKDTTAPFFSAPADITINKGPDCGYNADPDITGGITSESDNCNQDLIATYEDVSVDGPCSGDIVITRIWSLSDECGNKAVNQHQNIYVKDLNAPTFSAPADATIYVDANCEFDAGTGITGDVLNEDDNCSLFLEATFEDITAEGSCQGEVIITRKWSLIDDCGNQAIDIDQMIFVRDTISPQFTAPIDITISSESACSFNSDIAITGDVEDESDNCSSAMEATFTDVTIEGQCEGEVLITRTWSLFDDCGNRAADQVQLITVRDEIAPNFTAPADITIGVEANCGYDASVTITGDVEDEDDNCTTNLQATYSDVTLTGACEGEVIIIRTWELQDACGNAAAPAEQLITVKDTIPPSFKLPDDLVISSDSLCGFNADPSVTGWIFDEDDNCGSLLTPYYNDVTVEGACTGEIIITRQWWLIDDCGNQSDSRSQIITVRDDISPTFSVPLDVTLYSDINCDLEIDPVNTGDVIDASDNCSTSLLANYTDAFDSGACEGEFVIYRTWNLEDDCGNAAISKVQTIMVRDTIAPSFMRPMDITIGLDPDCNYDSNPIFTGTANAISDNCSTGLLATYSDITTEGGCPGEVIITRSWSLSDFCGNQAADQVQLIWVKDMIAPVSTGLADTTYQCASDVPMTMEAINLIQVEDNCTADVTVEMNEDSNSGTGCKGDPLILTRTFTLRDCAGLTSEFVQIVTVEDTIPPTADIPADLTLQCSSEVPPLNSFSLSNVLDNCTGEVTVQSEESSNSGSGCFGSPMLITRTFTLTDCGGLTNQIVQTIKVEDTQPPVGTAPADLSFGCISEVPSADIEMVTDESDNCGNAVNVTVADTDNGGLGCINDPLVITRTFTLTDCGGLQKNLVQMITVIDSVGPVLNGDTEVSIFADCSENIDSLLADMQFSATDLCSGLAASISLASDNVAPGNCSGNYTRTVIYEAKDLCNNVSAEQFVVTINVTDLVAPVAIEAEGIADVTVNCDDQLGILAALSFKPTFEDDCSPNGDTIPGILRSQMVTLDNSCPNGYTHVRFWSVEDECGNKSEDYIQTILVVDETAPVITCPADITINCGESTASSNTGAATAIDNCSNAQSVTITQNDFIVSGACSNESNIIRTWTAEDECGNMSFCQQYITVVDEDAPVFSCPADLTLEEDEPVPAPEMLTAIDNCDGDIPVFSTEQMLTGEVIDTLLRTYVAVDECGNEFSCIQSILVPVDITMACPDDIDIPFADRNCVNEEIQSYGVAIPVSRLTFGTVDVDISGYANGGILTDIVVFDSEHPTLDPDLGTPNLFYAGPGVSSDHVDGENVTNNQSWGNILVITQDGSANDHAKGDSMVFDFSEPVLLEGITLIDVSDPEAELLIYQAGSDYPDTVVLTSHESNDLLEISLNDYSVTKLAVHFGPEGGSGGVAQMCFKQIPEIILEPGITLVSIDDISVEEDICSMIVTRALTVNEEGNDVTCEQVITYEVDYQRPQTFCPETVILSCGQPVTPPIPDSVDAVDNCTPSEELIFQFVLDSVTGTGCEIEILRVYKAIDAFGNEAYCRQMISYENVPEPMVQIAPSALLYGIVGPSESMSNEIFDILPLSHPYGAGTYEYLGSDSVHAMPEDVVDWVLVELRTSADTGQSIVARTSALLREDGSIMGIDGKLGVSFAGVPADYYYVAIRQRAHLDIMTDTAIYCGVGVTFQDFSIGGTFGTNAQFEFAPGRYAMWPGDYNFDGVIDAGDRSIAWNKRNQFGYLYEDVNMDGVVDASERSIAWNNRNKASFVPHE